jgi:hypothetical protein
MWIITGLKDLYKIDFQLCLLSKMIKQKRLACTIEITNPNYMSDMDNVLKDTIQSQYNGKLISNYIIVDANVLNRGLSSPSLDKGVIAKVDIVIGMNILIIPQHIILENCVYQSSSADSGVDQTYHLFTLQNDNIPIDILNRLIIVVQNNGLSSDVFRRLDNLSQGDVIPLFVVTSTPYHSQGKIGCFAIPNFDDKYSPVFKFTQKMVETGKFSAFGKIVADRQYKLQDKKFVEARSTVQTSTVVDFLNEDELFEYISMLVSLS